MPRLDQSIEAGKERLKTRMDAVQGQLGYESTAYHLPISYSITGVEVKDAEAAREAYRRSEKNPLVAAEALVALSTSTQGGPGEPYTGFVPDTVIRKLGYTLVDGSILGLALLVGKPARVDAAAAMCRELQEKFMLTFLAGEVVPDLTAAGVRVGLDYRLVPLGPTPLHGVHFADILARVAMMFGGVPPGDAGRLVGYAQERARAIVIALSALSDEEIAFVDALRILGIPILSVDDYTGGEWIPSLAEEAVQRGMEMRGIKVKVTAIPIPMACSPAFEGKSIRKEEMHVEFGGGRSPAFELLRMRPAEELTDGNVNLIGPDIEQMQPGSAVPLGILVDVAGGRMRKDFEPVLERRIHNFVNYGEGTWHVAQRNLIWVRFSKEAVKNGLRMEHLGKLIGAKFKMDFPDLLDKVEVTILTDREKVLAAMQEAENVYEERDARIRGMTDADVDTYYSCTLCQTFAPNHVCIITPERTALCGAITWLDGRTAYEISPSGANQPVVKGEAIDAERGEYEGINRFVRKASHGEIERCSLYSLMDAPMTCCGCFECIAVVLPEVNGIMVVNREYTGETPSGMTFSTLAGTIGGGAQTPGFAGISKTFILSDRFFQAEEGIKRLVWMPSQLKAELADRLMRHLEEIGEPDLFDKIADETVATTIEELTEYLEKVGHPALSMEPLL